MSKKYILPFLLTGLTALSASEGIETFKSGSYEKAYKVLKGEVESSSSDRDLNFYLGRAAFETGKYKEAVAAYERVLIVDEGNQRARLEMARAYLSLDMYEAGEAEFNRVLASNPPESVKRNIEAFLSKIDSMKETQKYFTYLAIGFGYDSNINSSPAREDYPANEFLTSSTTPIDTYFLNETIFFNHDLFLNRERTLSWMNTMTVFNQNNTHNKENEKFDVLFGKYATGIRYKGEGYIVKVPLSYSDLTYGGGHLMNSYGITPDISFSDVAGLFIKVGAGVKYKRYDAKTSEKRDADYTDYSVAVNKRGKEQSYGVKMLSGANTQKEDNTQQYIDNDISALSGFYQTGFGQYTVGANIGYTITKYDDESRKDTLTSVGLNLSKKLSKEMALSLNMQSSKSTSNKTAGKYTKNLIGFNYSYSFGGGK